MITKPVTFVLGAGASHPFGFPLGEGLISQIGNRRVRIPENHDCIDAGDPVVKRYVEQRYDEFCKLVAQCCDGSIDEFLRSRPTLADMGKLHIAAALCALENPDKLLDLDVKGHWLRYLWKAMKAPPDHFAGNRVSFVVFNYDRTIEHFLCHALAASHEGVTPEQAWAAVSRLTIVHPHGLLGRYSPNRLSGRRNPSVAGHAYHPGITFPDVTEAAKAIRLFWEPSPDQGERQAALEDAFAECEHIVFLGFGFHRSNLEFLLPLIRKACERRSVTTYASLCGMSAMEQNRVLKATGGISKSAEMDALTFIRGHVPLHEWSDSM